MTAVCAIHGRICPRSPALGLVALEELEASRHFRHWGPLVGRGTLAAVPPHVNVTRRSHGDRGKALGDKRVPPAVHNTMLLKVLSLKPHQVARLSEDGA